MFVEIQFDCGHLVAVLKKHFPAAAKLSLMGTIQFTNALHRAHLELSEHFSNLRIPQGKPLSPGNMGDTLCTLRFSVYTMMVAVM